MTIDCNRLLDRVVNSELTVAEKVTLAYYIGAVREPSLEDHMVDTDKLRAMCGNIWFKILQDYVNLNIQ